MNGSWERFFRVPHFHQCILVATKPKWREAQEGKRVVLDYVPDFWNNANTVVAAGISKVSFFRKWRFQELLIGWN
jgi:hypothetical protein